MDTLRRVSLSRQEDFEACWMNLEPALDSLSDEEGRRWFNATIFFWGVYPAWIETISRGPTEHSQLGEFTRYVKGRLLEGF